MSNSFRDLGLWYEGNTCVYYMLNSLRPRRNDVPRLIHSSRSIESNSEACVHASLGQSVFQVLHP